MMTATEHLKGYGVTPRLKPDGSLSLSGMKGLPENIRAEVVTWAKNHRETILKDLTGGQKGQKAQKRVEIEPMTECLHGKPCRHLQAPGRDTRPTCKRSGEPVFDMRKCPAGFWFMA